jgi:hypothetical protein
VDYSKSQTVTTHDTQLGRNCALWLLLGIFLSGCASNYTQSAQNFQTLYSSGDYDNSLIEAQSLVAQATPENEVVLKLQLANVQREAGKIKESVDTFESVENLFQGYDATPEVSLSAESISAFSNPYVLPYRGRSYDRIMAATYRALNYLELGDQAKARVALNRALFRQEDAKRIAAGKEKVAQEEMQNVDTKNSRAGSVVRSDEVTAAMSQGAADFVGLPVYQDYMNPLSVWLHGVFFLHTAQGIEDVEKARKSLERAQALAPQNPSIKEDAVWAATTGSRPAVDGKCIIYVVHETGEAPAWTEHKFQLPLIIIDRNAPIVTAAFPKISPVPNQDILSIKYKLETFNPTLLASMDGVVVREFNDELPVVRTRAVASASLKAITTYVANKAAEENNRRRGSQESSFLYLATIIATNTYTSHSAQADLRNWATLPKNISMVRMVVPISEKIYIQNSLARSPISFTVPNAKSLILYCKTPAKGGPLSLHKIILNP